METLKHALPSGAMLTAYLHGSSPEMPWPVCKARPAVIICPGGAYRFTSAREQDPPAAVFLNMGLQVFVLEYSVGEKAGGKLPLEELASSAEPQLMPNFVADEKEFYYQSGKLFSKLSFMDPKDSGAAIDNITVRIADADSRIPAGAIAFGSGDTLTPVKKMGRLAPGDVFDIVWNLDIDRFFSIA